ncbi:hypothetical protein BJV77DRAFT_1067067 [Russula vinacea]|nr:hypothetical protein BJV77DRAFT_1067067 [Russula vinacea]
MVKIFLNADGTQVPFLSIPDSDVQRLSRRPFKWLRYVIFAICGAHGDISMTLDGPPVDYSSSSLANATYHYNPTENFIFVDHECLNGHATSTASDVTHRHYTFRQDIKIRDGQFCIVTQEPAAYCDEVHLIPRCKGDEYISRVIKDRCSRYEPTSLPFIKGINDIQNGVLVNGTLHKKLACGDVAFIKTPNYGLEPDDIWRVDPGPTRHTHITLHQLVKHRAHVDAVFQGTGEHLPPDILLDYMYGVAAYKCWRAVMKFMV